MMLHEMWCSKLTLCTSAGIWHFWSSGGRDREHCCAKEEEKDTLTTKRCGHVKTYSTNAWACSCLTKTSWLVPSINSLLPPCGAVSCTIIYSSTPLISSSTSTVWQSLSVPQGTMTPTHRLYPFQPPQGIPCVQV